MTGAMIFIACLHSIRAYAPLSNAVRGQRRLRLYDLKTVPRLNRLIRGEGEGGVDPLGAMEQKSCCD